RGPCSRGRGSRPADLSRARERAARARRAGNRGIFRSLDPVRSALREGKALADRPRSAACARSVTCTISFREHLWQHRPVTETRRKLLVVEDDPGIQSQLRWCFEDYDVLAATDRAAAINELRRHEPAVVLQDLGLPPDEDGVEEGFATLREILSL